jgi:spore coat polysaccharide biosynthesis predicted glycosyltransferase SpsG
MSDNSSYKIVFVNEASPLIGMGHILRDQVLARMLNIRGYQISGLTIGDEKAVLYAQERCKGENFDWPILTMPNATAAIEHILNNEPSIILVDCSKTSQDIVHGCKNNNYTIVALDYFSSAQPLPAAVINLIDHNHATLNGQSPARDGVAYYEGPEYAIIRDDFLAARARRGIQSSKASVQNILIAFGGADPAGNSQRAVDIIIQWPGKFIVNIVVGPLFPSVTGPITNSVADRCSIKKHTSPANMDKLLEDADLVFCGGGGTLLEAMCVGIPAIVIAQNEEELRHAKSLAQREACWLLDDTSWEIVSQVNNRRWRSERAQACVDGRGAERVCNVIAEQIILKVKDHHHDIAN